MENKGLTPKQKANLPVALQKAILKKREVGEPEGVRSREASPVRVPPETEKKPRKKRTTKPKEPVAEPAPVMEKKERKKREPKEKPTPIHVCREKATGLYKRCKDREKK
jgi:hypothetical protein